MGYWSDANAETVALRRNVPGRPSDRRAFAEGAKRKHTRRRFWCRRLGGRPHTRIVLTSGNNGNTHSSSSRTTCEHTSLLFFQEGRQDEVVCEVCVRTHAGFWVCFFS